MQWNPDGSGKLESAISLDLPRFSEPYFFNSICFVFDQIANRRRFICGGIFIFWNLYFLPRNWKLLWQKMTKLLLV